MKRSEINSFSIVGEVGLESYVLVIAHTSMLLEMIKSKIARVLLLKDLQYKQRSFTTALELIKLLFKLEKLALLTA